MARLLFAISVLCAIFMNTAVAQEKKVGGAMFLKPFQSGEELARALEKGDKELLRATPEQFFEVISINYPEVGLSDISQLPDYIRTLSIKPCPLGKKFNLSRILLPSGELDFDFFREFREGEICLFDLNLNLPIMSLTCGNVIIRLREEIRQKTAKPISVVPISQVIKIRDVSVGNRIINNYNYDGGDKDKRGDKKSMAGWKKALLWTGGAIVVTAAGMLIYDILHGDKNTPPHFSSGGDPVQDIGGPVNPPNRLDPVPGGGGPVNPGN